MDAAPPPTGSDARRLLVLLVAIGLATVALNAALFWTPAYRSVVAPDSSAGRLLATLSGARRHHFRRDRDVLVVGDSRMFRAFDPQTAALVEPRLRFTDVAVPGTTPRCWPYVARAADPAGNDLAAVVIPVDSYADVDTSLGAGDADAHSFDLHYLAVTSGLRDVPSIAASFPSPRKRLEAAVDLSLRGPLYGEDVQALLADPQGRAAALAAARAEPDPTTIGHADVKALTGLQVDRAAHTVAGIPPFLDSVEGGEITAAELADPKPSPAWGAYRLRWLGALAERYRSAGVPVNFVRLPARPVALESEPSDAAGPETSIGRIVARGGAVALPAGPYVALEDPDFFSDHDHLNQTGARLFSTQLAHEVARALKRGMPPVASGGRSTASEAARPRTLAAGVIDAVGPFGTPMELGSLEFGIFVVVVLALWNLPTGPAKRRLLLGASWYFYARWNAWYLVVLIGLTTTDYALARVIERERDRPRRASAWLATGVAANLAFLGTCKYANFLGATLGAFGGHGALWKLDILVPIGISFHTFQSIAYLVDVRRGELPARKNFADYALYLAFFPQLLAGPIVRAAVFLGELDRSRSPRADVVGRGLAEIARGLVKKFALADNLAPFADAYFGHVADHTNALSAWTGTLAFALQIFFDFSGYSDIAIGIARLFGFNFPENFRRPYFATGASDFWRRWHISLSTWLRDYLYIPLGGNRGGLAATVRNLMITMLLGGLWHGAGWTFLAWGAYHGAWLSVERTIRAKRGRALSRSKGRATDPMRALGPLRVFGTFAIVTVGWVLFRAGSLGDAATTWLAMAGVFPNVDWSPVVAPAWVFAFAAVALACEFAIERGVRVPTLARLRGASFVAVTGGASLALLALELLRAPTAHTFVYFKF